MKATRAISSESQWMAARLEKKWPTASKKAGTTTL